MPSNPDIGDSNLGSSEQPWLDREPNTWRARLTLYPLTPLLRTLLPYLEAFRKFMHQIHFASTKPRIISSSRELPPSCAISIHQEQLSRHLPQLYLIHLTIGPSNQLHDPNQVSLCLLYRWATHSSASTKTRMARKQWTPSRTGTWAASQSTSVSWPCMAIPFFSAFLSVSNTFI